MKLRLHILVLAFLLCFSSFYSQVKLVRENLKWGVKENDNFIIQPIYDTIFGFDSTQKICLACYKKQTPSANKFIKSLSVSYSCNYLNKKNERLVLRNVANDTLGVFPYSKTAFSQFIGSGPHFVAGSKGKKHLFFKNFHQLTFNGYYDIDPSPVPKFYYTHYINEGDVVLAGLINEREEEVIPHQYSTIKINTKDSLIIACSAGVRPNAEDDVFDYEGKKKISTLRHIHSATKKLLIHKIYQPNEYYILYNLETKEEKILNAEEVNPYTDNELLIQQKNDWFIYDLSTNQKKPFKPS